MGADILRLYAITYSWAEPGTDFIHLPQMHEFVKLLQDIMGQVPPSVALISPTNVPHRDNVSHLGNALDEAHMDCPSVSSILVYPCPSVSIEAIAQVEMFRPVQSDARD